MRHVFHAAMETDLANLMDLNQVLHLHFGLGARAEPRKGIIQAFLGEACPGDSGENRLLCTTLYRQVCA